MLRFFNKHFQITFQKSCTSLYYYIRLYRQILYMALLAWKNITAVYAHRCALELFCQFPTPYPLPPM